MSKRLSPEAIQARTALVKSKFLSRGLRGQIREELTQGQRASLTWNDYSTCTRYVELAKKVRTVLLARYLVSEHKQSREIGRCVKVKSAEIANGKRKKEIIEACAAMGPEAQVLGGLMNGK